MFKILTYNPICRLDQILTSIKKATKLKSVYKIWIISYGNFRFVAYFVIAVSIRLNIEIRP